jgi:hypothetical protein
MRSTDGAAYFGIAVNYKCKMLMKLATDHRCHRQQKGEQTLGKKSTY